MERTYYNGHRTAARTTIPEDSFGEILVRLRGFILNISHREPGRSHQRRGIFPNQSKLSQFLFHRTRRLFRSCKEQCIRSNRLDRKSTRLNSSHVAISYAVFCLKKKRRFGASHAPQKLEERRLTSEASRCS